MKTLLMISAATLFGASAALAQDNQTFITLDSNQNGSVSFDEAVIADPSLDRASFDAQDSDGDGSLNVAEFEAWLEGRADAEANADVGVESDVDSDPVEDNPVYDEPQDSSIESEAGIEAETGLESETGIDPMEDPMDDPLQDPITDPEVGNDAELGVDTDIDAEGSLEDPMRG